MKVLSLFDGISSGMVALERAGIPVERYVAYEIEPNAIKISKKNYPQIEQCGDVTQPQDKGIVLKDIVLPVEQVPEKYFYTKYPITVHDGDIKVKATIHSNGHRQTKEVYGLNHKCNTLLCDGNGGNFVKKIYQDGRVRKLMPIEYERLQTLPDNFTNCVADSRRYTAIGNGWTVDVIAHILEGVKE